MLWWGTRGGRGIFKGLWERGREAPLSSSPCHELIQVLRGTQHTEQRDSVPGEQNSGEANTAPRVCQQQV